MPLSNVGGTFGSGRIAAQSGRWSQPRAQALGRCRNDFRWRCAPQRGAGEGRFNMGGEIATGRAEVRLPRSVEAPALIWNVGLPRTQGVRPGLTPWAFQARRTCGTVTQDNIAYRHRLQSASLKPTDQQDQSCSTTKQPEPCGSGCGDCLKGVTFPDYAAAFALALFCSSAALA